MKTTFDIENIIIHILSQSSVKKEISGGMYHQGDRPDNSTKEDIVVNTIAMSQDNLPQIATTNVNIYVQDVLRRIDGVEQTKPNNKRIGELTALVLGVIREARVDGMMIRIDNQTVLQEKSVNQHFCNIRLSWNIQIN